MRKFLKITAVALVAAGSAVISATPVIALPSGGGHTAGFHGGPAVGHSTSGWGGWHGGWGGWHGGWGGWHGGWGGWHGGWGGWHGGWGWGWGWGPGLWAWPWYWGTSVVLEDPYLYGYDPYYGPPPPPAAYPPPSPGADYGPPPASQDDYNCTAWRWDDAAKKYVQVRSACH